MKEGDIIKIGNLEINGKVCLAPMAGVADRAFRELCMDFGACMVTSEMVSAKAISFGDKKSYELMKPSENEHPFSIQLFGNDPEIVAFAAKEAVKFNPQIIDLNMGCPAPKVTSNGCGSALMKEPSLCAEIVKAVKASVNIPVSIKIRKGWDEQNINALEIATLCQDAGADAIAIHGRTAKQMYKGKADWDIIKDLKKVLKIPVIGNGDILTAQDAVDMLNYTGCDMLMVGRGALGNPFIFRNINALLDYGTVLPDVGVSEKLYTMLKHVHKICEYKGEEHGMKEARKHICWYAKGLIGGAKFRNEAGNVKSLMELNKLTIEIYKNNKKFLPDN